MYHYKDIPPEKTIKNITQFFLNKDLKLQEYFCEKTEINTYWCTYFLLQHNRVILRANGKGITKILAMASCFAELYERFCNFAFMIETNAYTYNHIVEINKERFNKNNNFDKIIQDEYISYYLNTILPDNNKNYLNRYINMRFNGNYYEIPYYNLSDTNIINYKNFTLLTKMTGTNGLAAGNSIEEALVQGSSELYEREAINIFFQNKIKVFYQLNSKNLNIKYQKIINHLLNNDIKITVYDLSYNLKIPVVCICAFIKQLHCFAYCFGSHPIFDIALERCFTEIYQGWTSLFGIKSQNFITYYKSNWSILALDTMKSNINKFAYINENLILNSIIVDYYNQNIYYNNLNEKNINNQQLLNHIKTINKNNNCDFEWTDISLSDNIKAIHIIESHFIKTAFSDNLLNIHKYDKQTQETIFNITEKIIQFYNNLIIKNEQISLEKLNINLQNILKDISILNIININEKFTFLFQYLYVNYYNQFTLEFNNNNYEIYYIILEILCNHHNLKQYPFREKQLYDIYKLIELYYTQQYSKEQIKKILNWLEYSNIELDFELEDMTPLWYINKIFIEPLYDRYHSQEYYDFINIFGPDETIKELGD